VAWEEELMRMIHTADWQIGKVFKQFGDKEESLRQARLTAIENIGRLAVQESAGHVLVAGDVFDNEVPTEVTLRAPLERMKLFPQVKWHLLPGNHDPHRPQGLWERLTRLGMPANVHLHLEPTLFTLGSDAVLLPAPLTRRSETNDLTDWMDTAETPPGILRIGLAHGSITGFGGEGEANNPIDPDRPVKAKLDYLALGDWHRTLQVGPSAWYAGTPEPDRAGSQEQGQALLIDIAGAGAPAIVTPLMVGTYRWLTRDESFTDGGEVGDMDARLRAMDNLSRVILRLRLTGTITLAGRAELWQRLLSLKAAMFHLDADQSGLQTRPTQADLEAIDFDGVLRRVADNLLVLMTDGASGGDRLCAQDALIQLYLMQASSAGAEMA
jgi:DNA repair exonuclease SbcCD nuclease subunit